jgi:hypothetical protein
MSILICFIWGILVGMYGVENDWELPHTLLVSGIGAFIISLVFIHLK